MVVFIACAVYTTKVMRPSFKTGIKKYFFYGIALLILLLFSSPFIITPIINSTYVKNKIASVIHDKTGAYIEPSKFSLIVFPQLSLLINNFNINPDNRINVDVESLKLTINLQKLLHGKFTIDKISIHHPQIKTGIEAGILKDTQALEPAEFPALKFIQGLKKVLMLLPENQDSVELTLKDVTSPYFKRLDGSVYLSKNKEEISVNATIKDIAFNPSMVSPSLEKYLDLKSMELDRLKIVANLNSKGELHGQLGLIAPTLTSKNNQVLFDSNSIELSFKLSDKFYQVDVKQFKLNYPDGSVAIHFLTDETQKKSELQFIGTRIHIDQAREMSLVFFKDNAATKILFDILHKGFVPKINVSFQSKDLKDLFNENHLTIKGNIEDGLVNIPETNLTASRVSGNADIQNGILEIKTDSAMIRTSKIEQGNLNIDLFNYIDYPFQGDFLLDVDLSMVPQTLIHLLPDTLLSKELSLVHDVTGRTKATLSLLLETNSSDLNVTVKTDDFSVTGLYDRIPGDISLENINFVYEPDLVYLKKLNGSMNGCTIYDLNTDFNFKNDLQIKIQSGSGIINLDTMIPWLMSFDKIKEIISPVQDGKGKIHVASIDLSGPIFEPNQWEYNLKGTGMGIDLTTHLDQQVIKNLSFQYHLSDDFLKLSQLCMKIIDLSLMESFIETKLLDNILVPLDLKGGIFYTDTTHASFKTDLKFSTGPELLIDLKGETPTSLAFNSIKFIDPGFSDGSISFNQNKDKSPFDFEGILNTTTLKKLIKPDSFWTKKINDLTSGQPIIIHTDKDSNLNIITKNVDLNSLVPQADIMSKKSRFLPDKIINFKADNFKYKKLTFTHIDSILSFKKDHSYIRLKKAFLCDLETGGYINLKKDIVYASVTIKAHNKDNIQDLLSCNLFQNERFMDGRYSLTCNFKSNGTKNDFFNKSSGSILFNAQKGRIYKLTLISRILSVLNVSNLFKGNVPNLIQEGFAYNSIIFEADIKDSIIYPTKAVIDGQDMTLIFSGWIDPIHDKLDLICLVAPFKTVDLIIKHIPIVNTLLDGRLVSVPIEANGKLSDPKVTPLHPAAVGTSLINMMSDILKTPVKLWDDFYNE